MASAYFSCRSCKIWLVLLRLEHLLLGFIRLAALVLLFLVLQILLLLLLLILTLAFTVVVFFLFDNILLCFSRLLSFLIVLWLLLHIVHLKDLKLTFRLFLTCRIRIVFVVFASPVVLILTLVVFLLILTFAVFLLVVLPLLVCPFFSFS